MQAVGAEGDGSDIRMTVGHRHEAHVLLTDLLSSVRELRDGGNRGGLGSLASGVGIDFRIEDEDVHVAAAGQHVVDTAEADIIRPSVAADDEDHLVGEVVLQLIDLAKELALSSLFAAATRWKGGLDRF